MKILHLDIETGPHTAHVWGLWQQNVGLPQIMDSGETLCFAAKWHGVKGVHFSSVHEDGAEKMLQKAHQLLSEADAVVHYNGKKFDMPTLNKEFILNDMPPPDPYHQIDLLQVARKTFKFASNKLDYVANALGLGKKVKHIGHELWVKCMAGDDKAWKQMERYNKQDVVLLEKLYKRMLPWITNHPNHGIYTDSDRPVCPNCGSTKVVKCGVETTKTLSYQRYRCKKCYTPLRGRHTVMELPKRKVILTQVKK